MKVRTFLKVVIALASTLGIIIPVAICARPRDGYRISPILGRNGDSGVVSRPPKMQLSLVLRTLGGMEVSQTDKMSATQARNCLALIEPWHHRPRMSDDEAQALSRRLTENLSPAQRDRFAEALSGYGSYARSGANYDVRERLLEDAFRQVYNPFFPLNRYKEFQYLSPEVQQRFKARFIERQLLLKAWKRRAFSEKVSSRRLAAS